MAALIAEERTERIRPDFWMEVAVAADDPVKTQVEEKSEGSVDSSMLCLGVPMLVGFKCPRKYLEGVGLGYDFGNCHFQDLNGY